MGSKPNQKRDVMLMKHKSILDKLYYEELKQPELFQLTKMHQVNGECIPAWKKWRDFTDLDPKEKEEANNRSIADVEIVLDIDEDTKKEATKRHQDIIMKLEEEGLKYRSYFTGSTGYHIHLLFPDLRDLAENERKKFKESFIKKFDCDLMKAGPKCMIAIEACPHWKTGKPKNLLIDKFGYNVPKIEKEITTKEELIAEEILQNTRSVKDFLKDGVPKIEWTVQNILPKSGITSFVGAPKSFKSFVALDLALSVCSGRDFLDNFPTDKSNVLIVDEENGNTTTLSRINTMCKSLEVKHPDNVFISIFNGIKLDNEEGYIILDTLIEKLNINVVILDSMVRLMEGDENFASDVRKVFDTLKKLRQSHDVSFVLLHHLTKDTKSPRGSGDFMAFVDVQMSFVTDYNNNLTVSMDLNRHIDTRELSKFKVRVESSSKENEEKFLLSFDGIKEKTPTVVDKCYDDFCFWITQNQLVSFGSDQAQKSIKLRGHTKNTIFDTMKMLLSEQKITKLSRGYYGVNKERFVVKEKV